MTDDERCGNVVHIVIVNVVVRRGDGSMDDVQLISSPTNRRHSAEILPRSAFLVDLRVMNVADDSCIRCYTEWSKNKATKFLS